MLAEKLALLTIGDMWLALPQRHVATIELLSSVVAVSPRGSRASGFIEYDGREWKVFSLNEGLAMSRAVDRQRRFCVCFGNADHGFALLCDDVSIMEDEEEYVLFDMPPSMAMPRHPIQQLLWGGIRLIYVSDLVPMNDYLYQGEAGNG